MNHVDGQSADIGEDFEAVDEIEVLHSRLFQIPHDFLEHFAKLIGRFLRHRLEIGLVTKIWIDRDTPNLFEWIITGYFTTR